ncbi:MAG: hypothetical protein AB9891_02105 [Anaerolineaceae bacterium]
MDKPGSLKFPADTRNFIVLNPQPPFVDILLELVDINPDEFGRIDALAESWENDPRLIEMVRLGGDGSAKVPYLMEPGETPESILATLRDIARPHLEHLESLPEAVQATIHLLLSINSLPKGCDAFAIPALLEIDRIHAGMVRRLHELMADRPLARKFREDNMAALKELDSHWETLRKNVNYPHPGTVVPHKSRMEFEPVYKKNRLVHIYETCVIVPTPGREILMRFTPRVLQRPLPVGEAVPPTGSVDWLLREAGKVGRHFTRALLHMVKERMEKERISLEVKNYELIRQQALLVWEDFVKKLP